MKKSLYLILFCLFFLFPLASHAQSEKVIDFSSDIVINQDSSLVITEKSTYDFDILEKHGIYRDIIEKYQRDSGNYYIDINIISVTDDKGNVWPYQTSTQGIYYRIKIGDASKYVTGQQVYNIKYEVKGAINYFSDHDELYWNVAGTGWPYAIEKASATVHLPQALETNQIQKTCYTGTLGSKAGDCQSSIVDSQTVSYSANNTLGANQDLTIVLGWPKGIVAVAEKVESTKGFAFFTLGYLQVLAPVIVLLIMLFLWYTRGRDPAKRKAVYPIYEPPDNLKPGEMGVVYDESADPKDISATIISLAARGYFKIKRIEKKKFIGKEVDYEFIKLKEADDGMEEYERKIFNGIFDLTSNRELSDLKNKFYTNLKGIKSSLYDLVVGKGYFPLNPDKVRTTYYAVGAIIAAAGFFFLGFASIICGVVIIAFSRFMSRKTTKGVDTHSLILGFKWFLSVTETERLKFHNAPAKNPQMFEKFLPYAMIFGVEEEWAKQFEDIYKTPPSWYEGDVATFSALYFATSLSSMSQNMSTAMFSRPGGGAGGGMSGFGGGGFSGGGFGGGGGGSW